MRPRCAPSPKNIEGVKKKEGKYEVWCFPSNAEVLNCKGFPVSIRQIVRARHSACCYEWLLCSIMHFHGEIIISWAFGAVLYYKNEGQLPPAITFLAWYFIY